MSKPEVVRCPDGHFRRAIYSVGPFIVDYPEKVYLAAIVQGWCPKYVYGSDHSVFDSIYWQLSRCLAPNTNLDEIDAPRFRELSHALQEDFEDDEDLLLDAEGIASGVMVCLISPLLVVLIIQAIAAVHEPLSSCRHTSSPFTRPLAPVDQGHIQGSHCHLGVRLNQGEL